MTGAEMTPFYPGSEESDLTAEAALDGWIQTSSLLSIHPNTSNCLAYRSSIVSVELIAISKHKQFCKLSFHL